MPDARRRRLPCIVVGMTNRMAREEFFGKLAPLDEGQLQKALWTLYWRGTAQMRERIEDALDPKQAAVRKAEANAPADAELTLRQVTYFAELARSGAYFARDYRVTPSERRKWRVEFKLLATDAISALRGDGTDSAIRALEIMIDVACETAEETYFRSDDPMAAARFIVSDAAESLWSAIRHRYGWEGLAGRAAPQFIRWERRYGWTLRGDGWVAERERSLAAVIAPMLPSADTWSAFAISYVDALDALVGKQRTRYRSHSPERELADNLAEWHGMLLDRLIGTEHEHVLDAIAEHHALAGPERTFVAARLAHIRGDDDTALTLAHECLQKRRGEARFQAFAAALAD